MDGKLFSTKTTNSNYKSFGWSTYGTARSKFEEILKNDSLKQQLSLPILPKSIKNLKLQFAEIQIGSELFFQALNFLFWVENTNLLEKKFLNQRFLVLLSAILLVRRANIFGSICIPWKILKNQISAILLKSGFSKNYLSPNDWKKWLLKSFESNKCVGDDFSENTIFVERGTLIYFQKNWLLESELLSLIRNRLRMKLHSPKKILVEDAINIVLEKDPVRIGKDAVILSPEQKEAIFLAVCSPFLIITGGPGTGKTLLIIILLRVLKRLGLADNPALAAPTGRAAKRMSESVMIGIKSIENLEKHEHDKGLLEIASEAKTLHRLLKYNHSINRFKHHEYEPLENDLLIIDEGSMIEHELLTSLLNASNSKLPYHCSVPRIILLGDENQLPSIGSGAVFSELASLSDKIEFKDTKTINFQTVRLFQNFRHDQKGHAGRNILRVAEIIKDLYINKSPELLFESNPQFPNETIKMENSLKNVNLEKVSFLNQVNSQEEIKDFAYWWVKNFLSNRDFCFEIQKEFFFEKYDLCKPVFENLLNYFNSFRILTVTRVFSTGSKAINQIIRELWISMNETKDLASDHYPGEPVMITKNNYNLKLFNGDMGIFLKFVNPENGEIELKAVFQIEGVFKTFYDYELSHTQTSYAITVHKSQGSEYDHLALILPELTLESGELNPKIHNFHEIMSSEMLYTALTRAKKSVLILGKKSVFEYFALNKVLRFSGLSNNIVMK